MRLIVIGAGPAYTDRRGATGASYLLTAAGEDGSERHLLLDLGHGSFANLASTLEPSILSAILISHLHPDHFIDLVPLRHYLRFEFVPPRRMAVFGPAGLADRLDQVNGDASFSEGSLDIASLESLPAAIGPFHVQAHPVTHAVSGSFAYRVSLDDGPGLVYTGDCGRADDLLPLIRRGDTLLSEASFGAGPVDPGAQHLDSHEVGRVAHATGAARVLLTHLQMGFDRGETIRAAQQHFDGPAALVTEGDCFSL